MGFDLKKAGALPVVWPDARRDSGDIYISRSVGAAGS
jgi:hypothetical protein